jgi:hypothetical protein
MGHSSILFLSNMQKEQKRVAWCPPKPAVFQRTGRSAINGKIVMWIMQPFGKEVAGVPEQFKLFHKRPEEMVELL